MGMQYSFISTNTINVGDIRDGDGDVFPVENNRADGS